MEHKIFKAVKILRMILQQEIRAIIDLSRPVGIIPRLNPNVSYGLLVIMCQCRLRHL